MTSLDIPLHDLDPEVAAAVDAEALKARVASLAAAHPLYPGLDQ